MNAADVMATRFSDAETGPVEAGDGSCVAGASIADVLRLLSTGATGAILMALGEGPLRTMELTERVPGYASGTIYRYAGKLAELNVIEREEEPGVPSKVVHALTEGCGRELYELVDRYAQASMSRLPDGRVDAHAWASLGLLAELWETGMIEELSWGTKSTIDLAGGPHGLTYHQVHRRAGLFKAAGLIQEEQAPGRLRCYALTDKTRKALGLIVGIAHWRRRPVVVGDGEGMTAAEMATVLRAALPLVSLPDHAGKCLRLSVLNGSEASGGSEVLVCAEIIREGALRVRSSPEVRIDGCGDGRAQGWLPALLDGTSSTICVEHNAELIDSCLAALCDVFWMSASGRPTPGHAG